jgi:cytochrome c553
MAAGLLLAAASPLPADIAAWLHPGANATPPADGWNTTEAVSIPGSAQRFTEAQLHDLQVAVDWFPDSHPALPAAVARGPVPGVAACGFCHLPGGEGRPENASLAGLDEAYLVAQGLAFRNGVRHGAVPGWLPSEAMTIAAKAASEADIRAAAAYFSRMPFTSRVKVVETATVRRTTAQGYMLVAVAGGAQEPIGDRIVEIADDHEAFERRDPRVGFTAFVPPGSIARGAAVAERIGCLECHSGMLGGWGPGRSPSYILRQLHGFGTGVRIGEAAAPMREVVGQMTPRDMIDVAAWYAAQQP